MSELLQKVLTDTSVRDKASMTSLASEVAEEFLPWNTLN